MYVGVLVHTHSVGQARRFSMRIYNIIIHNHDSGVYIKWLSSAVSLVSSFPVHPLFHYPLFSGQPGVGRIFMLRQ